jgi:ABC-type sugar transport system permease subunit
MGNPLSQLIPDRFGNSRGPRETRLRRASLRWLPVACFLAPALLLYLGFVLYPVFQTIYNSFFQLDMTHGMKETYVGLSNFVEILAKDEIFFAAAQHSLTWGLVSPLLEIPLALLLALLVYRNVPGARFFRVAWFTPMLVSYVVVGIIWRWIFNYDWGVPNELLRVVGLSSLATDWLGTMLTALPSLIFVTTWMFTGFNFVVLLAALHSLPSEVIDAARVDGASDLQLLLRIIIPLLRNTIASLLILCFIGKMKIFDLVWVMTRGGPMWATETVSTYVIKRAFDWRTLDLGYPSAIAVLWFIVILALSLFLKRVLTSDVDLEF